MPEEAPPPGERRSRRSRLKRRLARIPHPHLPHLTLREVRLFRLFGLLFVFSVLVLYAVFRSARAQELLRARTERYLSSLTGRTVTIGRFDVTLVPLAFSVSDLSVSNDPRGLPGPCFSAEEISIRGRPLIARDRVSLPKVRVISPRVVFEVFEDGTSNLTSLLEHLPKTKAGPGLDVRVEEALVQRGTFRFRELSAQLDVLLNDAAVTARAPALSRLTTVSLATRRARFRLEDNRVLDLSLGIDATLSPNRIHVDALRLRSDKLSVDASGGVEDLRAPVVALAASAATTGEALGEVFGLGLPLRGPVASSGTIRISPREGFRIRGRFQLGDSCFFGPFPMRGAGSIRVAPDGLLAHVERAEYAGGEVEAFVRLTRLKNPPLPVRLAVKGRGVELERFFSDIDLKGTGLLARADVDATLTFGRGGIEHADGAGELHLTPMTGARSMVAGRHAIPTSGGGPLLVRDGKIGFQKMPLVTAGGTTIKVDGTLAFGSWIPDLDFDVTASDLADLESVADDLYPAIRGEPLAPPLKLGGSGHFAAHLSRTFSDPRVTGRLEASDFVLRGVRFGASTADFVVDHDVLTLSPFRAADPPGTLTLTGSLGWGGALKDHYRLDGLAVDVAAWPLERVLAFLDIDLPLTGRVTGHLPLDGVTPALAGAAPLDWELANVWGQPVDLIRGVLAFERDRLRLSAVEAVLGGGSAKGAGFYRFADRGYEFDVEAAELPLEKLGAEGAGEPMLTGRFSGRLRGSGTIDRPGIDVKGQLADAAFQGSPLGVPETPISIAADVANGRWTGILDAPGAARLTAETVERPGPRTVRLALDVSALEPYRAALRLPEAAALSGSLAGQAFVTLPEKGPATAEGALTRAEIGLFGRRFTLDGEAPFTWSDGALRIGKLVVAGGEASAADEPRLPGAGSTLTLAGSLRTAEPHTLEAAVTGAVDAALVKIALPEAQIAGRIVVDAKLAGTLEKPTLTGRLALDSVDFAASQGGASFESITGSVSLSPGRVSAGAVTLGFGGGTVDAGVLLGMDGLSLTSMRVNAHLSHVRSEPFPGFRATVSGDLVLLGDANLRTARGELTLDRGVYDADIDLGLGTILGRLRAGAELPPAPTRFDSVGLDVRILAPLSTVEVHNNLARLKGHGELVARGTWGHPLVFGSLEAEEGGQLTLRDLRYELLSGRLLFSNPQRIEPYFEIEARTNVKDYQISLGLSGTMARLVPRFTSDPPLSDAQIVSLLATGELPGTTTIGVPVGTAPVSTDESISSAARELIASLATQAVTNRTKQFFRLDRLQIDPVFVGSSFDAPRLTIGKSIGRDLTVTYSYKASANREQVIIVEYQVSSRAFLQFVRDETGVYSVDLKFRQRLR
jgi:hypothetical protein